MKVMPALEVCDHHFGAAIDNISDILASITEAPESLFQNWPSAIFLLGAAASRLKAESAGMRIVMSPYLIGNGKFRLVRTLRQRKYCQ